MAIEIEKNNLKLNQIIANKKELATIEGDCIVPDVKPDIMSVIGTSGIVNVYKKEVSDGKIRIDGAVSIYVMYNGNDGDKNSVRSINHVLDFSQIITVENANKGMNDIGGVELNSIDCRMVNERKINLKANLNFDVKLTSETDVEYVGDIDIKDLQKLESKVKVNSIVGIGNTKTSISEKMPINSDDDLAEILKMNATIVNTETKISYNKVLIKADVIVKILYSTEDGRINLAQSTFPVMGFIDMKDISDDSIIDSNIEIKNSVINPNGSQEHSITLDIEIGMEIIVYNNKEISIIKDMYSPSKNLDFTNKKVRSLQNANIYNGICSLNQKELLNIGDEKVYDVDTQVIPTDIKVIDNAVLISGNVMFNFIYSTNKLTGLDSKKISVPFDYRMPCDGIRNGANINLKSEAKNENINVMPGGEVELKIDIIFIVNSSNITEINLIENVEENNNESIDNYNMVIYYTKDKDNLWKIAKEFKSTKSEIIKDNKLENEKLQPGTQLFITRYTG